MTSPDTNAHATRSPRRRTFRQSLAFWSLVGLGLGLALGLAGHAGDFAAIRLLSRLTAPVGQLWLNALQLVVLPLVVTQMLAAVTVRHSAASSLGNLGVRTLGLIVFFLVLGSVFTLLAGPPALRLFRFDPAAVDATLAGAIIPDVAADAAEAGSGGGWFSALVPANLLEAALGGEILGVLLFTVGVGLAVSRLPEPQREPLARLFAAAAAAMMQLTRWILVVTPAAVFALILEMSLGLGLGAVGILASWVAFVCALLVLFTGLLYPLTALLGRVSMRAFARAVLPAQVVAIGTRSSLACLPALVESGRSQLRLPAAATGFVMPLCVTIFKQNRTISSTAKLLFLAYVFGVPLAAADVVAFILTVLLLSFSAVGIPRGGVAFTTLPAYLAAGLPIQGVVILEAVETIPDFFKTVLNTTADMSVTVVASGGVRDEVDVAIAPESPAATPTFAGDLP